MLFECGDSARRGVKFRCCSDAPLVVGSEVQQRRAVPVRMDKPVAQSGGMSI